MSVMVSIAQWILWIVAGIAIVAVLVLIPGFAHFPRKVLGVTLAVALAVEVVVLVADALVRGLVL